MMLVDLVVSSFYLPECADAVNGAVLRSDTHRALHRKSPFHTANQGRNLPSWHAVPDVSLRIWAPKWPTSIASLCTRPKDEIIISAELAAMFAVSRAAMMV